MARIKKDYTLTLKGFDHVLIKTNRGNSNYYPYEQMADFLEVSAEINVNTISLKTEFRDNTKIEWHYRLMRNENDTLANWQGLDNAIRYSSEESINEAKQMIIKAVKGIKKILKTGKNHPVYTAMAEIVKSKVLHYQTDFNYHDILTLAEIGNEIEFVWIVRNSGTWLLSDIRSKEILTYSIKENKYRKDEDKDFYFWYNGKELKQIDSNEVLGIFEYNIK